MSLIHLLFSVRGRLRRDDWWFSILLLAPAIIALDCAGIWALSVFLHWPLFAVSVKRLHDVNRSGWWLFLPVILLVVLLTLVFGSILYGLRGSSVFSSSFIGFMTSVLWLTLAAWGIWAAWSLGFRRGSPEFNDYGPVPEPFFANFSMGALHSAPNSRPQQWTDQNPDAAARRISSRQSEVAMSESPSADRAERWRDLIAAYEFARDRCAQWGRDGLLGVGAASVIADYYAQRLAECAERRDRGDSPPANHSLFREEPLPSSLHSESRVLRLWEFLDEELQRHQGAGRIPLANSHACLNAVQERVSFLRRKLGNVASDAIPVVAAAPPESPEPIIAQEVVATPRRSILEILLDPRSIQWFLALGAALLVFGLVLYLYTKGIFENKLVVAASMGVANAAIFAGGWWLILRTRYQLAGRALTLLACLVMPLNLWFYHAQDIITLQGHLWIAGVVVCGFYAASAWVLRDWMFVPVLMGGVAMTGLLLLADLGKFWEVAAPATFLTVLGLIGIHVERAFADDESPFGRKRFGLAFFFSGHALLAAGLLLVLTAQMSGNWLYPFFRDLYAKFQAEPSPIAVAQWGQLLAMALVGAGVYAHLYSDFVVRRKGVYVYFAALGLLWALVLLLDLLNITIGIEVLIAALALTALSANLAHANLGQAATQRAFPALGLCLALSAVILGVVAHFRATNVWLPQWKYDTGWAFVAAMAVTVVSCRVSAHLVRNTSPTLTRIYFFATAAAEIVGAAALLRLAGLVRWEEQAWILMLIPIAHAIAASLYGDRPWAAPVLAAGQAATVVMLLSSVVAAMHGLQDFLVKGQYINLQLAAFFSLAGVFYLLTATLHAHRDGVYLAAVMLTAAIWQVMLYYNLTAEYYTLTFALLGLALLIGYRFGSASQSGLGRSKAVFDSANGLLSVAFVASLLQSAQRLGFQEPRWQSAALSAAMTVISLAAIGLVRHAAWRRWYVVTSIGLGLVTLLTVEALTQLTAWQKAELFSAFAGLVLLIVGHVGWRREREQETDLVSFALGLGSLLVGVPLIIATVHHRFDLHFSWPDELGLLVLGLALLATGFAFELKATTLTGAAMATIYVLTLPLYARGLLEQVQTAAILIAVVGGLIFGIGILLAVWRDRLLTLPARVRNREGIYRVLSWR